ncbi:hypothetical protein Ctha_1245 [Chloroherpeton thalassium ATCC 35110]|uniref:Lipoprotein n=1 Tax=Chloroherpeton thalassium (strain ATCC 35110 / GB-78) TaxID=517418 RepID=B3QZ15_CHLT3|nr:hypothetical protein [Chloroherpeton thalassium]ACF13708.1 hypothetical protein Ctha_1245 [Chloroherpeton thalassium ATCC 35110]
MKKNLITTIGLISVVLLISCASSQNVVHEIRFRKLFTEEPVSASEESQATLSVVNETSSPKLFVIEGIDEGAEKFKMQFTLKGNKDYFLKPGKYQITYYAVFSLEQVSKTFEIAAGEKLKVKFFDIDEYKSDFIIID